MALVIKDLETILNSQKIIEGLIIYAHSEKEARDKANTDYPLMALSNGLPSMDFPEPPELNSIAYCDEWLKENLTSCELLES